MRNIMDNQRIAQIFEEIANILDINGENRFRVLAYRKAAQNILNLPHDLRDIYDENPKKLEEIPGIGKDLSAKIAEMLKTGKCSYYNELLNKFDKGLLDILRVRGIGPKKVKYFYKELAIDSIDKLRKAASAGKIQKLPGMGVKSENEILNALKDYEKHQERLTLYEGLHQANKIVQYMKKCPQVEIAQFAGSLRRMQETIGDIDILVAPKGNKNSAAEIIMRHFLAYSDSKQTLAHGETKSALVLHSGLQVDLRVIDSNVFGAALCYFTGSKGHNIVVRDRAKKMGLKINEYGVFRIKKTKNGKEVFIAGKTEEEIFKAVKLPFIIPEMREDRGEVDAAAKNTGYYRAAGSQRPPHPERSHQPARETCRDYPWPRAWLAVGLPRRSDSRPRPPGDHPARPGRPSPPAAAGVPRRVVLAAVVPRGPVAPPGSRPGRTRGPAGLAWPRGSPAPVAGADYRAETPSPLAWSTPQSSARTYPTRSHSSAAGATVHAAVAPRAASVAWTCSHRSRRYPTSSVHHRVVRSASPPRASPPLILAAQAG